MGHVRLPAPPTCPDEQQLCVHKEEQTEKLSPTNTIISLLLDNNNEQKGGKKSGEPRTLNLWFKNDKVKAIFKKKLHSMNIIAPEAAACNDQRSLG